MPVYVFENKEHGLRAEVTFAIDERPERIVLERKTCPDTVAIAGSSTSTFAAMADPRTAYQRLEARGDLDPRRRGQSFTDAQRAASFALPPT